MKILKTYKKFKESIIIDLGMYDIDITESMNVWHDVLLNSISSEEKDIFDTFKLPKDYYQNRLTLDFLSNNVEFINSLSSVALKKSPVQNTEDFESFLEKPCKFMFIYNIESNELQNPVYIIFETWNDSLQKWDKVKLYKINGDIKNFYDKLSSKVIEIIDDDGSKYIYQTSNKNEFILQSNNENDKFKKYFRKSDFNKLLKDNNLKINLI